MAIILLLLWQLKEIDQHPTGTEKVLDPNLGIIPILLSVVHLQLTGDHMPSLSTGNLPIATTRVLAQENLPMTEDFLLQGTVSFLEVLISKWRQGI